MSFPNHIHGQARVELGREWGKASAAKRKPYQLDWHEQCRRNANLARGQVLREGISWTGSGLKPWKIVRSVRGRINQVDLIVGTDYTRTGSLRAALSALRWGKWPA